MCGQEWGHRPVLDIAGMDGAVHTSHKHFADRVVDGEFSGNGWKQELGNLTFGNFPFENFH